MSPRIRVQLPWPKIKMTFRDPEKDEDFAEYRFAPVSFSERVEAVAVLVGAGFDPSGALFACGLEPIEHLGLSDNGGRPVAVKTIQRDRDGNMTRVLEEVVVK